MGHVYFRRKGSNVAAGTEVRKQRGRAECVDRVGSGERQLCVGQSIDCWLAATAAVFARLAGKSKRGAAKCDPHTPCHRQASASRQARRDHPETTVSTCLSPLFLAEVFGRAPWRSDECHSDSLDSEQKVGLKPSHKQDCP